MDPNTGLFADGGEIGGLMRSYDWSTNPLGPSADWPQPLRTLVALMLGSNQPMFIAWGPERIILYNDRYAPLLGNRHPRALGRHFYDVWFDIRPQIQPIMERAYAGKSTHMDDIAFTMCRHGYPEEAHFAFSYTPVRDDEGRVEGMFCACAETTGKVIAERAQTFRLHFEERLRDLGDPTAIIAAAAEMLGRHLGVSQVGYGDVDAGGEWITVSVDWSDGRIPTMVGRHRLADFGQPLVDDPRAISDITPSAVQAFAYIPIIMDRRLVNVLAVHHREPRFWTAAELASAREAAEWTWAAVARARAGVALRESEARFRHMADHAPVMVWVTDPEGRCTYVSRSWYDFTAQAPDDALGLGWQDALHPDDREGALQAFQTANATRAPYRFEYRLRWRGGGWRWVMGAAAPRLADDGSFLGHVGSVIDITERKEAEIAMARADRAKSRFLAVASHDLRQPMQSLLLFRELLRPHVAEKGRDAFEHLGQGLDTMRELLDGLLDLSRLESDVVTPDIEDFAIREVLEPIGNAYAQVAAAKRLELHIADCPAIIRSDRALLGRMLRNLLENALRHTHSGRVAIRCHTMAAHLRVEIHDTGVGIRREDLDGIWEEFRQVGDSEQTRGQGLGLGLAIVRRLSRLLGHSVTVSSVPNVGSVFAIEMALGADAPNSP
ncbi:MAG: PAS domain-containing protein [Alphaproteobacteria bacterium]|nr:PAS domain-containing protein [Alphaproteobacteria bacterium]